MLKELRIPFVVSATGIILILAAVTVLPILNDLSGADTALQPHAQCLLYTPGLIGIYTVSDLLTGLSYLTISFFLLVFVHRARRDIPFNWVFLAFGGFIFFCGLTHFFDVVTLWTPVYWTSAGIRALTALASVTTALTLPPLLPRALRLIENSRAVESHRRQVIQTNQQLAAEVESRGAIERELRDVLAREQSLSEFRTRVMMRLSHELRTPLAIAQTASDLLKYYYDRLTQAQRIERLNKIQHEIGVMSHLLGEILTIGQYANQTPVIQRKTVDLAVLCSAVLEEQRLTIEPSAPAHPVIFEPPPKECSAPVDSNLFRLIVTNLISNAEKYSPPDSPIILTLTCTDSDVVLTVRDQGIGIAAEDQAHIFETFFRGANVGETPGTGMGLSIVKMAVDLHGGSVSVTSEIGSGALFTVTLPLSDTSASS